MDDDWGITANAPPFRLFKDVDPEEEAKKVGFVDMSVYNHWKKPQRRIYNKLKADQIKKMLEEQELKSIDELADTLQSLEMFKSADDDPVIRELIFKVSNIHVQKGRVKDETKSQNVFRNNFK